MPCSRKRNGVVFPPLLMTNIALVNLELGFLLLVFGYQQMIASTSPTLLIVLLLVYIATAAIAIIWSVFVYRSSSRSATERLPLYFMIITLAALSLQFVGGVFLIATMHVPMLDRAVRLANTYVEEHKDYTRAEALAMAADTLRDVPNMSSSEVSRFVDTQVKLRVLSFGALVEGDGRTVATNDEYFLVPTRQQIAEHIEKIKIMRRNIEKQNIVVVSVDEEKHAVIAMVDIPIVEAGYLVVGRVIDKRAVDDWKQMQMYVGGTIRGVWVAGGAFVVLSLLVTAICLLVSRRAK